MENEDIIQGTSFDLSYRRTTYSPIDSSSVFKTKNEATIYALNNYKEEAFVPYAGQIISVLENNAIYKLVPAEDVVEIEERKGKPHFKLVLVGSQNDNDDRYVRKDIAETIEKLMTFVEGINVKGTATLNEIILLRDLVSRNFAAGSTGFGITQDADGNYHLDIDFVNIRRKLTVQEIQVQQSSYVGGKQWNTAAGIICSTVEDKGTYWRCYFKTTDAEGRTVHNTFQADDQAICETFNMDKQASGALGNHYYWRLVLAAGDDYIDLSKSDFDTGSDAPQVGDNIVQLGNRSDTSRQGAICWDSVTEGGPYVRVYKGINSYHLPQPNVDLNPEESIIKAKLVSEATGKEFDTVIDDMQADMDLIKQQTDKEYTLWFFDYDPTLKNVPASDWNTEDLKVMHEQDMFYNTKTGQGYRFEKSDSAWVWNNITDHLTLKALEDAAKAQDTADKKRRIFVSQPTTADAYDVGDLWVNATYSSSALGVEYKNDTLVCKTAKVQSTVFNIAHWQPSSTATTAYLENLGDQITIAVTNSEQGIAAAKELANKGINDAYDAYYAARGAQRTADQNTAAIQVTKNSISALVEGISFDNTGKFITNISRNGLITTDDFALLYGKEIVYDKNGHVDMTKMSGLVTSGNFVQMFTESVNAAGLVHRATIDLFVQDNGDGSWTSKATVNADLIRFNGRIVANGTFEVDTSGNLTLNNIIANNGTFNGTVNATSGLFDNVTINSGKIGGMKIQGESLTNEGFNNDACIILRNDKAKCFAGIGGNTLPISSGRRAVARFENEDDTDKWGLGANYACILSAANATTNYALYLMNGFIGGMAVKTIQVSSDTALDHSDCFVSCYNKNTITIHLPPNPQIGKMIFIMRINNAQVKINGNGRNIRHGTTTESVTSINHNGEIDILVFDGQFWMNGWFNY